METRAEGSSIIMQGDWKLIHYLEDGMNFMIWGGSGEQNNLTDKYLKAKEMRVQLDQWLKKQSYLPHT